MLARANRVIQPSEFRTAVRCGRRVSSRSAVVHVFDGGSGRPTRFGFIVSKAVGNAVARNVVRRRLRALSREILVTLGTGKDIVIRALPGSPDVAWASLKSELTESINRGVSTR